MLPVCGCLDETAGKLQASLCKSNLDRVMDQLVCLIKILMSVFSSTVAVSIQLSHRYKDAVVRYYSDGKVFSMKLPDGSTTCLYPLHFLDLDYADPAAAVGACCPMHFCLLMAVAVFP